MTVLYFNFNFNRTKYTEKKTKGEGSFCNQRGPLHLPGTGESFTYITMIWLLTKQSVFKSLRNSVTSLFRPGQCNAGNDLWVWYLLVRLSQFVLKLLIESLMKLIAFKWNLDNFPSYDPDLTIRPQSIMWFPLIRNFHLLPNRDYKRSRFSFQVWPLV